MRDAQIDELFVVCKFLERDAAFLVSDCLFVINKMKNKPFE